MGLKKNVLIICYSFPPYPGIGGRRWAKFAKYFAKEGVTCHVINSANPFIAKSIWTSDTIHPDIVVHSLPFRFRNIMTYTGKNVAFRAAAKLLRTFINFTKYSPHYFTSLTKKMLIEESLRIIKEQNIKTVIVSGDPYISYYASLLKEQCDIKLILDYRDLWNDREHYKYHHVLTKKQRAFFESCENEALNKADTIVGVYNVILEKLRERNPNKMGVYKLIPNGYDTDEYDSVAASQVNSEKITIYHGGSVALDAQKNVLAFLTAFTSLKDKNKELLDSFQVIVEGNFSDVFKNGVSQLNNPNIVLKRQTVPVDKYLNNLASATMGIISLPDDYKDAFFITKTFDYFYMHKPIIAIGPAGEVSAFIESNHIGYSFNTAGNVDAVAFFENIKNGYKEMTYTKELSGSIDKAYNIKNLAAAYINEIV